MTAKHLKKEVAEGQKLLKQISNEQIKLDKELQTALKAFDNAVHNLANIKADPAKLQKLRKDAAAEESNMNSLSEKTMNLEAELSAALNFEYKGIYFVFCYNLMTWRIIN
jgi:hypothetical protein